MAVKLYVRIFTQNNGRQSKFYNKTFRVESYEDYLQMITQVREALWRAYRAGETGQETIHLKEVAVNKPKTP